MTEIATIDWLRRWGTSVFSENTALFSLSPTSPFSNPFLSQCQPPRANHLNEGNRSLSPSLLPRLFLPLPFSRSLFFSFSQFLPSCQPPFHLPFPRAYQHKKPEHPLPNSVIARALYYSCLSSHKEMRERERD